MKIYLATFYSSDLKRSANRFKQQAEEMKVYDKIFVYNQDDLNQDFKDYIHMLLKKGKERGYGHWVWQTYIHQLVLSQIDYGDIYHWCDVGCHFNQKGIWRLKEYIDLVNNDEKGFLFFSYKKPIINITNKDYDFPCNYEYQYTKPDLLKYFNLKLSDKIAQTPQVWGGSFFLKKTKTSENLMKKHYDITRNRYDLIDDDESKFTEECHRGFIAHRHSQSVLSILAKKENCKFLSAYESEWALNEEGKRTYEHLKNFPIIAKRDKQKNLFARFLDRQKKNFKRRLSKLKNVKKKQIN